jgi:type IV pilus assembly protein PilQ
MNATRKAKVKRRDWTAVGICVVMVLGLTVLPLGNIQNANAESLTAEPQTPEPEVMMQDSSSAAAEVRQALTGQSIQTINFKKDMPIKDALRMLAQMYQKNIVPTAAVDGIVTVTNLYDVTFEEALQAILGPNKYEIKGNFIKVYTNEEYMQDKDRFEHAIITLYYVNSEEARKLAEPLLSEFGKLGATTAAPTEMEAGKSGDTLAVHDRLVVSDYPENIQRIRNVLAEVDVVPLQVLLEVTIMSAELTETTEFGIDWSNVPGVEFVSADGIDFADGVDQSAGNLTIGITFDKITGLIQAVESITDVTIMANPKILALNKQAGKLIIGQETGYLDSTTQNQSGSTTQSVSFLETGTILHFRPFIGRDGMIRMELEPEQSTGGLNEEVNAILPFKNQTKVLTNVMVKDGQTIVLGGLFQEKTDLDRGQTPIVGDIPVIGELFKDTTDESVRTELIVLITPHIISDPAQAEGEKRMQDVLRLNYEARKNLIWMSRAKIDEDRYAKAVELYTDGQLKAALAVLDCPYEIDRTYLDKIRLKERIIREMHPEDYRIQRLMLQAIGHEESIMWFRR